MPETRQIVRVFLASPGDLPEERMAAKNVADEINETFANNLGYHVELVGWEDTVSVYGRPQEIINADLDQCELFIGIMWKRWGTPPDSDGRYTSGFDEEFRRSVDRRRKEGRPEISLLFKTVDPEILRDPGEELRKVIVFKERVIADREVLFQTFSDLRDCEKKIRGCISQFVMRMIRLQKEEEPSLDQSQTTSKPGGTRQIVEISTETMASTPFSGETAKFAREFISRTDREAITPAEVARFRLLASTIPRQGNDRAYLGVHDANILYKDRALFKFEHQELIGLLVAGLEHYEEENTPLWTWYKASNLDHS